MPRVKKLTSNTLRKMVLGEKKRIVRSASTARRKNKMTLSESVKLLDALKTREAELRSAARKISRMRNRFKNKRGS